MNLVEGTRTSLLRDGRAWSALLGCPAVKSVKCNTSPAEGLYQNELQVAHVRQAGGDLLLNVHVQVSGL